MIYEQAFTEEEVCHSNTSLVIKEVSLKSSKIFKVIPNSRKAHENLKVEDSGMTSKMKGKPTIL